MSGLTLELSGGKAVRLEQTISAHHEYRAGSGVFD